MEKYAPLFARLLNERGLPEHTIESLSTLYLPILEWLQRLQTEESRPIVVGVNGAQGSGKSTFCSLLVPLLAEIYDLHAVTLSIDDVYLTREARADLGETVHPLCAIRGVPGTHDIPLAHTVLNQLTTIAEGERGFIPRFDKARDDRRRREDWEATDGPVDIVLFEGWCIGCHEMPPWLGPINQREARDDPEGAWMQWSLAALRQHYRPLFARLDALVCISVPSMDTVRQSRWLQEQRLHQSVAPGTDTNKLAGLMNQQEVFDYVALFERYTLQMLETLPSMADVHISRSHDFRYTLERLPGHSSVG